VGKAIATLGLAVPVEKVEDIREIIKFGVITTPALVVDGKVAFSGKLLSAEAIVELLRR
jgi:hypothetical protein